jgi:hypothetical protein
VTHLNTDAAEIGVLAAVFAPQNGCEAPHGHSPRAGSCSTRVITYDPISIREIDMGYRYGSIWDIDTGDRTTMRYR